MKTRLSAALAIVGLLAFGGPLGCMAPVDDEEESSEELDPRDDDGTAVSEEAIASGDLSGCVLTAFQPYKWLTKAGDYMQATIKLECPTPRTSQLKGLIKK